MRKYIVLAALTGSLVLGASTWAVSGSPSNESKSEDDKCATLYKKPDYKGQKKHVYDGDKDGYMGGWDNSVSSIKVYDNCRLRVWKLPEYHGDHKKYTHNAAYLGYWDNKISSYKCRCHDDDDNGDDDDGDDDNGDDDNGDDDNGDDDNNGDDDDGYDDDGYDDDGYEDDGYEDDGLGTVETLSP